MSDDLIVRKDMSFADLQSAINQLMVRQNEQLHKELKELKSDLVKTRETIEINGLEFENLRNMEIARHRAEEHRFGFVSLSDLGQCFDPSIGSKTMGKLLRMIGLAKDKQSKTEPLRSSIVGDYAKSQMYGDYPSYQWNPEKCIKKIDEWMMGKGLIDEFYSFDDEKKLEEFISKLYATYDT
jgi:hypothetical protein